MNLKIKVVHIECTKLNHDLHLACSLRRESWGVIRNRWSSVRIYMLSVLGFQKTRYEQRKVVFLIHLSGLGRQRVFKKVISDVSLLLHCTLEL